MNRVAHHAQWATGWNALWLELGDVRPFARGLLDGFLLS